MSSRQKGDRDAQIRRGREWDRRPGLSRTLRFSVFAAPVAASLGVAVLLSDLLPRAGNAATTALWIGVIAVASLVTLVVVERAARRLLPLAALLNLSLIFPDKAPARFAIARRSGRPHDLQASLHRAQGTGHEDEARRMETVIELVLALSVHDKASRGHSERVRVFTDLLADELKVPESGRHRLRWAALLHDIGKLEVAPAILNKPSAPSEEEWVVLHRHPEEGARLVAPLMPWLGEWGTAVEQHHERFDGTGYPHRLKGPEISLAARIVAVADVFEVMTAPRPYRLPMSVLAARRELVRVAGTQLDPVIVRAFLNVSVGRLWTTIGLGAWIAQIPTLGRMFGFGGWAKLGDGHGHHHGGDRDHARRQWRRRPRARCFGRRPRRSVAGPRVRSFTQSPADCAAADGKTDTGPHRAGHAQTHSDTRARAQADPGAEAEGAANPQATPKATPDPWSCAGCTNTAANCTSHCKSDDNKHCTTYCLGDNNKSCSSHCFGDNNKHCVTFCVGSDNKRCQINCQSSIVAAPMVPMRRSGVLNAAPVAARNSARIT